MGFGLPDTIRSKRGATDFDQAFQTFHQATPDPSPQRGEGRNARLRRMSLQPQSRSFGDAIKRRAGRHIVDELRDIARSRVFYGVGHFGIR